MAVNDLITFRKGTASAWTLANPVLASGEPGYDLTNSILKIGDGVSNWVALSGIGSTSVGGSSSSVGVRGIISTTGNLTSFAVSGGYPVGYLDLFQDGIKLVSDLDFSATDGSNVSLSNSVPSGTILEYLTISSGVSSGGSGGSSYDSRWDLFLPPAPTSVTASAGNTQVAVSWTAPTVLSQTPITDYIVQYSSNSGSTWTTFSDGTSTSTSVVVTGLSNGASYVFRVAGVNGVGTGTYSTASSAVTPISGDPYWANVQLLLPGDTSIADVSSYSRNVMANGGAAVSTVQSKWGGGSLLFNSVSKYLSLPSSGFTMTGDFVMECWVYMTGSATSYVLLEGRSDYNAYQDFVWYLHNGGYNGFVVSSSGARLDGTTALVPQNQWVHVAIVRSSGVISAYVNGVRDAITVTYSGTITPASSTLLLGSNGNNGFSGYIDDFRVTVGSNRGYTGSTITVPTAAFPDS